MPARPPVPCPAPPAAARSVLLRAGLLLVLIALAGGVRARATEAREKLDWDAWRDLKQRFDAALVGADAGTAAPAVAREIAADGEPRGLKLLVGAIRAAVGREDKAWAKAKKLAAGILKGRWAREVHTVLTAARWQADEARSLAEGLADQIAAGPITWHTAFAHEAERVRNKRWYGLLTRVYATTPKRDEAIRWIYAASVDPDPRVRARVLYGAAPHAADWPELISQRVEDANWAIQTTAARLAGANGIREAIGAMIGRLSCATPRVQAAFVKALEGLTGNADWGIDPVRWRSWWQGNRGRFGPQVGGAPDSTCPRREYATFYNLELQSDQLMLLVDVSSSMSQKAVRSVGVDGTPIYGRFSRIELVKRQLHRTIDALPRGVRLGMLSFGGKLKAWNPGLVQMTARERRRAHDWVTRLLPDGGTSMNGALTSIFGALQFGDCRRGALVADTLVLLSDGAPTDGWPSGRGQQGRVVVLNAIRDWNREHLVVIHTVALRGGPAQAFLATLATENGGHATVR